MTAKCIFAEAEKLIAGKYYYLLKIENLVS